MSSDEEEFACAALVVAQMYDEVHNNHKKRRKWTNDWLLQRRNKGSYGSIFNEISGEGDIFKKYLRISLPTFELLLEKVTPFIEKEDTHLRDSIPAGARLEATLLFLISGLSYSRLQFETRISVSSLSSIIPETCKAIFQSLKDDFMKVSSIIIFS